MSDSLYIQHFVRIKNQSVNVNGNVQTFDAASAKDFAEQIYRSENLAYPKFFKMDMLSKFGLLAAEYLLKNTQTDGNTSLVFGNKSASLDTDILHQEKIAGEGDSFQPSPAIFVYTLPNIMMGEICIKHKLQGENIFYVMPDFDTASFEAAINAQFTLGKATSFILAWVEILQEDFDIFACLLNTDNSTSTTSENNKKNQFNNTALKQLYDGTNFT